MPGVAEKKHLGVLWAAETGGWQGQRCCEETSRRDCRSPCPLPFSLRSGAAATARLQLINELLLTTVSLQSCV